ncbi:MAG: PTS sugar transporter subunit IIA [Erysipelotrichaceae bacterium]|nr:PTS sugar transporter subunit IIA [Erysipelotrichaceae bacterium]
MVHIVVATHGYFAKGILDSIKLICGEQENITYFCAYVDGESMEDGDSEITSKLENLLDSFPKEDEVVVLVDLLGGSVCNEFIKMTGRRSFHLIAGLNLGLLMQFVFTSEELTKEKINEIIGEARQSIVYVNDLVESDDEMGSF